MNRRRFTSMVLGAWVGMQFALARRVRAAATMPVIGFLSVQPLPKPEQWAKTPHSQRLRELGWVEGKNVVIEQARAGGRSELLPALVEDLVRKRVDVILANAPEAAVAAARTTRTVPIVFWGVTAPVELGLVDSLARPGGNVTGIAWNAGGEEQVAKSLELLREIAPQARRLASFLDQAVTRTVAGGRYRYPGTDAAAKRLGYEHRLVEVGSDKDLEAAFAEILDFRAQALGVAAMPFTARNFSRIFEFAARHALPITSDASSFVRAGGLVSYGPDVPATQRRAIDYVDRILRGARPGELPVELPSKYELAVNLKTAKTLGLAIPQSILLRADRVIE